jgi:hypothetical protein
VIWLNSLQGPSIFPILFAAAVARALKLQALCSLGKGAKLGYLDQLLGSSTLVKTITTQNQLRSWNLLGLFLVTLWALSPLGGQASLRIVGIGSKIGDVASLEYLNMFLSNSDIFTFESDESWAKADALFVASLLSDGKVKNSSIDSWGNVKIPMIESLLSSPDADGWYDFEDSEVTTYSSLIGIPIAGVPTAGNMTSVIETSYWTLDCPLVKQLLNGFLGANSSSYQWQGFYLDTFSHRSQIWQSDGTIDSNAPPRRLNYSGTFIDDRGQKQYDYAECDITTKYVEVSVRCSPTACEATKMRSSKSPTVLEVDQQLGRFNNRTFDTAFQFPSSWTSFDVVTAWNYWVLVFPTFSQRLFKLAASTNIIIGGTAVQHYFLDQNNPFTFDVRNMKSITSLPPRAFATSLAQLLNTYWLAIIGRNVVPMSRSQNFSTLLKDPNYNMENILSTTGQRIQTDVFVCHRGWLAVLIIASLVIVFSGIASIVLSTISISPELAMNMSTVLREAKHADLPEGGTTLDDDERGRLLKNVKVKMGDMAPKS